MTRQIHPCAEGSSPSLAPRASGSLAFARAEITRPPRSRLTPTLRELVGVRSPDRDDRVRASLDGLAKQREPRGARTPDSFEPVPKTGPKANVVDGPIAALA